MNAVFQCPRCDTPLGTSDDPRPNPLPPCPNCGWGLNYDPEAAKPSAGHVLVVALLAFAVGVGAGALGGAVVVPLLFTGWILGPAALVRLIEQFPGYRLVVPACCVLGFPCGFALVAPRVTGWFSTKEAFAFSAASALACLLVAWFVAWWRSE